MLTPLAPLFLLLAPRISVAELICGYEAEVKAFEHISSILVKGTDVQMSSLGVASAASDAPDHLDIGSPNCISRNCPVYLHGQNLDSLLPYTESTEQVSLSCAPRSRSASTSLSTCLFGPHPRSLSSLHTSWTAGRPLLLRDGHGLHGRHCNHSV